MKRSTIPGWLTLASIAVAIAVPSAIAISYWPALFPSETASGVHPERPAATMPGMLNTPFIMAGIRTPTAVKAHDAGLNDDEPIVGLSVEGRHRAYRVKMMSTMGTHVINDLVNRTAVTVTYCDRMDCVKVFTGGALGEPLKVETGGYMDGNLLLRNSGKFFIQATNRATDTGELVLAELTHTRTTWGEWRGLYPDTDVVTQLGSVIFPPITGNRPRN